MKLLTVQETDVVSGGGWFSDFFNAVVQIAAVFLFFESGGGSVGLASDGGNGNAYWDGGGA